MHSNRHFVEKYLAHIGKRKLGGREEDFSPLLPFLMLDIQYTLYQREIRPLKCRFELKHWKNVWIESYTAFNERFFGAYDKEEKGELIDKMDDFETFINNDLLIAQCAIMDCFVGEDFETQKILSTCMLCDILAQSAQVVWKKVYKDDRLRGETSTEIDSIRFASRQFMNAYPHDDTYFINCNTNKKVRATVDTLCRKMVRWLYQDA